MQCRQCQNLLHALHDGEITVLPDIARQHVTQCSDCAALQDDLQQLRGLLQGLHAEELDERARRAIVAPVARRIRSGRKRASVAGVLAGVRWPRFAPLVAAAAAVILLLVRLNSVPVQDNAAPVLSEQEFYLQEHLAEDESAFSDDVFNTVAVSMPVYSQH